MDKITKEDYTKAVEILLPLAFDMSGASRVAAQVLLSAYDGACFQLDIVELGLLDEKRYQAALTVIRGRIELNTEPYTLVEDGSKKFQRLTDLWKGYHVKNRHQLYG